MIRALSSVLCTLAITIGMASTAHAISFIDSPTAYCRWIKGDDCVINWGYMSVDATPNYMVAIRVTVNGKIVFSAGGFFQTSMYVANEFLKEGVHVKCGQPVPSSGPFPAPTPAPTTLYGNAYSWTIEAVDSAKLRSANYGTIYCPPKGR